MWVPWQATHTPDKEVGIRFNDSLAREGRPANLLPRGLIQYERPWINNWLWFWSCFCFVAGETFPLKKSLVTGQGLSTPEHIAIVSEIQDLYEDEVWSLDSVEVKFKY